MDNNLSILRRIASSALVFCCFFAFCLSAENTSLQQDRKAVSGKVVDVKGEALVGVGVVLVGNSTIGTVTDLDGNFSITVPADGILEISSVGFKTLQVEVKTVSGPLKLVLEEDSTMLEDAVVIGYGTAKRKDLAGSVSSTKIEDSPIQLANNTNALQSIKGTVAGLNIGQTSGAGGMPSMLIRGSNSLSGSNTPLILVDGVVFLGSLRDINPSDIASIDILKDASAAAAYGSRSANGVIAINTKQGRSEKPVITFSHQSSINFWQKPDMMDGKEWVAATQDFNGLSRDDYSFMSNQELDNFKAGNEIDWLEDCFRTGYQQNWQLSASGVSKRINYYLSTAYLNNKGVLKGDQYGRLSVLSKVSSDITDWIKIGLDGAYTNTDYYGTAVRKDMIYMMSPYGRKYNSNGELNRYPNGDGNQTYSPYWGSNLNPYFQRSTKYNNFRGTGFVLVKCPWLEDLSYRANISGNFNIYTYDWYTYAGWYQPMGLWDDESRWDASIIEASLSSSGGGRQFSTTINWVFDNILNYKHAFGKHNVDVTLVATFDKNKYDYRNMEGGILTDNGNDALGWYGIQYGTMQTVGQNYTKYSDIGYMARGSYNYGGKYYLTTTFRRDGASVFGANKKWGNFYAFAGAWRITEEDFFPKNDVLNDLKLRVSWGRNGNQGLSPYQTLSKVTYGMNDKNYAIALGNTGTTLFGVYQTNIGNASLGWETTKQWNFGFESSWLDNRLFADVDVYFAKTFDQIFQRTIPDVTGFSNMYMSLGEVANHGVEVTLRSINLKKNDFTWETGLTFYLNRSKLTHLFGEDKDGDGKEDDDIASNKFIGKSLNVIYGYEYTRLAQESDTEYMKANGTKPGTPMYKDLDGDGIITTSDRKFIGNTAPLFNLNISNTLTYKNLSLYAMLAGMFGGNGYFQGSNSPAFLVANGRYKSVGMNLNYWTETNTDTDIPRAGFTGDGRFGFYQSRGFLRLQDLTLAYALNGGILKQAKIDAIKVYCTAKNLFIITGWDGGDPELATTAISGTYPVMKSVSLGLDITF